MTDKQKPTDAIKVEEIAIKDIVCRKQIRTEFDPEKIAAMGQSIRENGLLQPLLGHWEDGKPILDDGEMRLRAGILAGRTTLPMILDNQPVTGAQVKQRQLVANCLRVDLNPIDLANGLDELMRETGWSAAQLSTKLGISPATISRLLALQTLPASVHLRINTTNGESYAS